MDVNYLEILRYMGVKISAIDDKTKTDIDKCLAEIKDKINPVKITAEYEIEQIYDGFRLKETEIEFKGQLVKNSLKDCTKIIIMIATLTLTAENLISSYSSKDMYLTVVLDACLTYYIEDYCDKIEQDIKEEFKKENLFTVPRFSCGYGDFDISYQKDIIKLLKADKYLGIYVNNANMLIPNKTVTAIIGVTKENKISPKEKCKNCNKQCIYKVTE